MNQKYKLSVLILLALIMATGCKKAVEVDPPATRLVSGSVYANNATATAAVTAIYEQMMEGTKSIGGPQSITSLLGLSADEFNLVPGADPILIQAYTNSMVSTSTSTLWNELYNYVYLTNAAIEGLKASTGVTAALKQQLTGEAKFMRAFFHFYLVNIFGDVPLVLTTDYRANASIARSPEAQVYRQIISDLTDAQSLLGNNFLSPAGAVTTERVRPNKGAATALLARAYLYTQKWDSAELHSTTIINNSALYGLVSLDSIFLKNSKETIWQLQPIQAGYNTYDGYTYILIPYGPYPGGADLFLSDQIVNSFEPGDNRYAQWIKLYSAGGDNYYYPYKYKVSGGPSTTPLNEYLMVLRVAEQYLIRAEARAEKGNVDGAAADLNMVRNRAGLLPTSATTQSDLSTAILHERQVELFTEWGHRWLDLKRTGAVNTVMGAPGNICQFKGGIWSPDWEVYPIPQSDILVDLNLTQNPGYKN